MALIKPESKGLARTWELVSTAISSATTSDTAEWGLGVLSASMYIITSNTPLMTVQIQESPDNSTWITCGEIRLIQDEIIRLSNPFWWLRVNVSAYSTGQIDQIKILGIIQ